MEEKRNIRSRCLTKRDAISFAERQFAAQRTAKSLPFYEWYQAAHTIYIYLSFGSEFDTEPLIEQAWADHKIVAAPRMEPDHTMSFYRIDPDTIFEVNSYGIREPKTGSQAVTAPGVMFLPGLGFDLSGARLGYGGGYYDRYLETRKKDIMTVALCFTSQIMAEVPCSEHDIRMDGILTEQEYKRCLNK